MKILLRRVPAGVAVVARELVANVRARDGHRYGFELVFFRQGEHQGDPDIDGRRFRYYKRLNRSGPGLAGLRGSLQRNLARRGLSGNDRL